MIAFDKQRKRHYSLSSYKTKYRILKMLCVFELLNETQHDFVVNSSEYQRM